MTTFYLILSAVLSIINLKGLLLSYSKMEELSSLAREEMQSMNYMFSNFMIAFSLLILVLFLVLTRNLGILTTQTIYILLGVKALFMVDEKIYFTKAKEYSKKRFIIEKSETLMFLALIIFCLFSLVKEARNF